jgi:alpha-mannosidase/mannosylglycerate hydrolase
MKVYVCAGSHWDREWYESFQVFRMWLVDIVDQALEITGRNSDYRCFHLDGQAVVLQDYLDIRPERKEELVKAANEGRIMAGPWYDLPDEWLISGESFIRNLSMGMRVCRDLGIAPMEFAYTPDQFGHVAALPMIMTGMGLKAGICWRGTRNETHPAIFNWYGPDGSRMATFKLRDEFHYSPMMCVWRNRRIEDETLEDSVERLLVPYIREEAERSPVPLTLLMDAHDHDPPHEEIAEVVKVMQEKMPDVEVVFGNLQDFGRDMLEHADELPQRCGEFREVAESNRMGHYLIAHTLSSRYNLKRENDECQALLEKWVEPHALQMMMAGAEPILSYVDKAWEYLLKNHPHDSICGCSIDQVHKDMEFRFDQCRLIGENFVKRSFGALAQAKGTPEKLTNVVLQNPLPFRRSGVFNIDLIMQNGWKPNYSDTLFSAERVNNFRLVQKDGAEVPYQLVGIERRQTMRVPHDDGRFRAGNYDIYRIAVETDLPACGHTGFKVEPTEDMNRNVKGMRTAALTADNGLVRFSLKPDGTADLTHLASRQTYENLFLYEDRGDSGDGWTYGQLIDDIEYVSPGSRVSTSVVEDGQLVTMFRVEREFDLPDSMTGHFKRAEHRTSVKVTDWISIEKGKPYIRVHTRISNTASDHRFRVLFPTHVISDVSFADTPFALAQRPIPLPPVSKTSFERVNPEKAFTTFCGLEDGRRGFAVLSGGGLHEYAIMDTADRALALTLYRSIGQAHLTSGQPGGQLKRDLDFDYLLYPFTESFDPVEALRHVDELQTGVRVHYAEDVPEAKSYVELLHGNAVVTAMKPSDDGEAGIIRLWNPTRKEVSDALRFGVPVKSVERCSLNEEVQEKLTLGSDNTLDVTVPPGSLYTVRFTW